MEKNRQANLTAHRGKWATAERLYREALAEFEMQGDQRSAAVSKAYLGQVLIASWRREEGCALLHEALVTLKGLKATHEVSQVEMLINERCGANAWLRDEGAIQKLMEIIATFTAAPSWAESQQMLEAHPELLSSQADKVFEAMIQYGSGDNQAQIIEQLTTHRDLLRLCRMIGVEDAFKQTVDPPDMP